MTTRRKLLMLLRKRPGATVAELATHLNVTGKAVRRHLGALEGEGLALPRPAAGAEQPRGAGRPPTGWQLSSAALELFPRRYDSLALDVLEELQEEQGSGAVEDVFRRRNEKLVAEYRAAVGSVEGIEERAATIARLRDDAGYLAECERRAGGEVVVVENNCAVHRVAERYPVVCAMELELLQRVLGPEVEVSREAHTMAGDPVCSYRITPKAAPR